MNETKAARYQRLRRRAQAAGVVSGGLMLAGLAFTPASRAIAGWSGTLARPFTAPVAGVVALVVFVGLLVMLWELAALPSMLYLGLRVDRHLRQEQAAVDDVISAQLHATAVALPAALVAGAVIAASAWVAGSFWWALAGVVLAVLLGAALQGAPAVLARLAEARPLSRPELAARLKEMSVRARVHVAGIDEWRAADAGRTTALVTGIGRRRRIFISADVVRDWSDTEIAVVVAHELAHHAHHDLLRTLAVDAAVLSCGLGAAAAALAVAARRRPARRSRHAAAHRARRRPRLAGRDPAPARAVTPPRASRRCLRARRHWRHRRLQLGDPPPRRASPLRGAPEHGHALAVPSPSDRGRTAGHGGSIPANKS